MSKYIRTKNEIIYVGDLIKDEYGNYCDPKNYETDMEVPNEYIIKEADTIEELSDRVFAFHKEDNWGIPDMEGYYLDELKEEIIEDGKNSIDDFIFKLAIWSDKGLIYVAQTNDEGELELL